MCSLLARIWFFWWDVVCREDVVLHLHRIAPRGLPRGLGRLRLNQPAQLVIVIVRIGFVVVLVDGIVVGFVVDFGIGCFAFVVVEVVDRLGSGRSRPMLGAKPLAGFPLLGERARVEGMPPLVGFLNYPRENDDYIYKGHILNGMSDLLFDIYHNVESAKELWDSLESKYMEKNAYSKKFLISNFNNYKIVNLRPILEQFNELLKILRQYTQFGLKMDESISVLIVTDKLPPSWKDFKYSLKHDKNDLSLVQLISYLRIEESLRAQESDTGKGKEVVGSSNNMMEEGGKNKNNKQTKERNVVSRIKMMVLVPTRSLE
uniref:Zinc finger, CCHC-type n=1 Tax=Tanacetum cinerariifolium TaxID=118510 RepID=A0A6L2M6E3_TANCI|nr:zinc finger, CCHC-type [Tanacetum cinerariifolium]